MAFGVGAFPGAFALLPGSTTLLCLPRPQHSAIIDAYVLRSLSMEDTIRWTVKVSPETDRSLRSYLGRHRMKKGDLSKFIERAVQKEILTQTAAEVKQRNADLTGDELQALIDDAVSAVRKEIRAENRAAAKSR